MEQLDLDLSNYNLIDLLKLFDLPYDFTKEDIKRAKRIVLMSHPDKSRLDKKFFLFFTSAFKIILKLYDFRYKSQNKNTEYVAEKNEQNEVLLSTFKNNPNFNKWFNEMFDANMAKNEYKDFGYGDWIKSDEDIDNRKATKESMSMAFENKKKEARALVPLRDFSETTIGTGCDLTDAKPESYGSNIFSKLQYEDLKVAHTETVVPVTMDDYINRKKYKNVNELNAERSTEIKPMNTSQSNQYFQHKKEIETRSDMERAFKLARQDEEIRKVNDNWWSKLKSLTN
jgi:hypothetical protein